MFFHFRRMLLWAAVFAAAALCSHRIGAAEERFVFEKAEMGVPFRITLYAENQDAAKKASDAAFQRVEVLNSIFSDYEYDSELSRLSRTSGENRAVSVSSELWKLLEQSQHFAERSGGAFDITIGPSVNLWRRSRRKRELPSAELRAEMHARTGYKFLQLDPKGKTALLAKPDMRLDLGGIAKGYAADAALAELKKHGVTRALVAASGDMAASEPPPGQGGWRVEVAAFDSAEASNLPPRQIVLLQNHAIATSGDVYQHVEIGGVRYSHILDPRTGVGLTDHSLVSIICRDGATADALATTVSVLGPQKGLKLVEETPGAAARIVRKPGEKIEVVESKRWRQFLAPSLP